MWLKILVTSILIAHYYNLLNQFPHRFDYQFNGENVHQI